MNAAITVEAISKRYQLTHAAGYRTLREALMDLAKAPVRRLRRGPRIHSSRISGP